MWQCAMNCIMWTFINRNCWLLFLLFMYLCVFTCICFSLNEFTDVLAQMNCVSSILSTLNKQHFRPIHSKWINPQIIENQLHFILMYNKHKFEQALIPYFPNKQLRIPQKLLFHMNLLKLNVIRPLECFFLPVALFFPRK